MGGIKTSAQQMLNIMQVTEGCKVQCAAETFASVDSDKARNSALYLASIV
jgi:hypothetical protein